jgi:hypothetical protein
MPFCCFWLYHACPLWEAYPPRPVGSRKDKSRDQRAGILKAKASAAYTLLYKMKGSLTSTLRRAASTLTKEAGDISSVFPSLSGKKPDPLPARFGDLKKSLVKGNEDAVLASWQRLVSSLRREIEEIRSEGSNVCHMLLR